MQSGRAIELLANHQRDVAGILGEARQPLAAVDASQMKAIALLRWELTRALREYQLFKHTEIFDPLIAGVDPARAQAAGVLKERCVDLGSAFAAHVHRWSLQGSATAWEEYQREATAFLDRIEQHLSFEMREVTALLIGINRTRKS